MKNPRSILNSLFVKAQARYPVATGALMHRVVAAASGSSKKRAPEAPGTSERISGMSAANRTAGIEAPEKASVRRTNGVLAANAAAGVPGYEALRG
ncbi:hypothetical protein [Corynebacterium mastitidis]|uniref:hypothetical protein n=1 Tax=Corynebacterium mastitidis TaxID=161890 RepID=UPI00254A9BE9|nr:hypothetical protein [Corynebacterium mastitidis]MDK8450397.1 hypothetical protein [Corynebacterium mastitidis]